MEWLQKKKGKFTSHDIQNEILKLMALSVLREIAVNLQHTEFYTIMVDECADIGNHEQVHDIFTVLQSICVKAMKFFNFFSQMVVAFRWVDDALNVHEDFIGLYALPDITASTIVSAIQDTLVRLNLTLKKARGQCYDGASTMRGLRNGVAKQIQDLEPRAIYTHCYGHSLNLAASDTVQKCKTVKAALETTHEITKLIKYSPRRGQLFDEIKDDIAPGTPGVRVLCPTRWTVRADSMMSILQNYTVLNELWDKACSVVGDTETIARIRGAAAQMASFDFFRSCFERDAFAPY